MNDAVRLLNLTDGNECEQVCIGDDWELIPSAFATWIEIVAGPLAIGDPTGAALIQSTIALSALIRAVYILGYRKGKRETVMNMSWKVKED